MKKKYLCPVCGEKLKFISKDRDKQYHCQPQKGCGKTYTESDAIGIDYNEEAFYYMRFMKKDIPERIKQHHDDFLIELEKLIENTQQKIQFEMSIVKKHYPEDSDGSPFIKAIEEILEKDINYYNELFEETSIDIDNSKAIIDKHIDKYNRSN